MLQEQPLLRIDQLRFFRRDVEEQRIELVDAGDEAAPLAVVVPALRAVLAEVLAPVPALFRDLGDAVLAVAQVLPVRLEVDRLRDTARSIR